MTDVFPLQQFWPQYSKQECGTPSFTAEVRSQFQLTFV